VAEQLEIAESTRLLLADASNHIRQCSTAIDLLQERRSALISAAVTGQIDVRDLVPEAEVA
jgi:type I restriction enzyme S subunit